MHCEQCQESLLEWVYGELDAAEARAVQAHLATCEACTQEAAALRELVEASAIDTDAPEASTDEAILAYAHKRTAGPAKRGGQVVPLWMRRPEWAMAATAVLAIGLGIATKHAADGRNLLKKSETPTAQDAPMQAEEEQQTQAASEPTVRFGMQQHRSDEDIDEDKGAALGETLADERATRQVLRKERRHASERTMGEDPLGGLAVSGDTTFGHAAGGSADLSGRGTPAAKPKRSRARKVDAIATAPASAFDVAPREEAEADMAMPSAAEAKARDQGGDLFVLAENARLHKDCKRAVPLYEGFVQKHPKDPRAPQAELQAGRCHLVLGQMKKAELWLTLARKHQSTRKAATVALRRLSTAKAAAARPAAPAVVDDH